MFTGYKLTKETKNKLLSQFPPQYKNVIAHHITEKFGVTKDEPEPEMPKTCQVVGYISEKGVEGLLVAINGSTHRPDGSKYHITWSLAEGRKAVDTNKYVNDAKPVDPIDIVVVPKNFHNE